MLTNETAHRKPVSAVLFTYPFFFFIPTFKHLTTLSIDGHCYGHCSEQHIPVLINTFASSAKINDELIPKFIGLSHTPPLLCFFLGFFFLFYIE